MSRLHYPLKDFLVEPVDEAAIHRIAEGIDGRRQGRRRRRVLPFLLVGTAAAGAILATSAGLHRRQRALSLADGHALAAVEAVEAAQDLVLSDGSHITLSRGAGFEPLQSSPETFWAIVTHGRVDFTVHPGGPRRWIIECGLATVEVGGTAFSCERKPGRLRVAVDHGVVLVRGEKVPDRARRLMAGESIELLDQAPRAPVAAADPPPVSPPAVDPAGASASAAAPSETSDRHGVSGQGHAADAKSWRALARRGRNDEAYALLGTDGLRRESKRLGVNDLLALADVARLSGHPAEAVGPLERILADFAHDAQAPLAAFALGRLQLDSLGHPQSAVSALRKALELGIPRSLREDVRARLVEAYVRSGDRPAAERAAEAYRDEFPDGRHAPAIRGWLLPQ